LSEKIKKTIYLNYHNLGYGVQVGINKVHPSIFKNHINLIEEILLKREDIDISITFDDGYENIYKYAQSGLNESSIKEKKVFIITDYIGKENTWDFSFYFNRYNHLNKDQIKSLHADGWEIGSHGLSHRSFLSINRDEAKNEIVVSKEILEEMTGSEVKSIAPPFSEIDQEVYDICVEAGYNAIYTQKKTRIIPVDGVDIFLRNNVYSIDRNDNIIKKINSSEGEDRKEKFISSFNNLTILFSKFLKKQSI
jgi:peptidoglycan/xylan/chitin deacetylase (PgdA/CDA1 family)